MADWYRCTGWNEQTEVEFFRRLKRARDQKPQYLVIQAGTLVGTGRPEVAAAALNLNELFVQGPVAPLIATSALVWPHRYRVRMGKGACRMDGDEDLDETIAETF